jgi:flagellar assembly factor FliW
MKIQTRYFGGLELDQKEIISFPSGIFGFEQHTAYVLIRFGDEGDDGVFCLQSVEDEDLAFVLINPFWVDAGYEPKPSDEDLKRLEICQNTPIAFFSIAVLRENFKDSTVNLRCPILVNYDTRTALQIVLEEGNYSMRAPVSSLKGGC